MKKVLLKIGGMSCSGCASGLQKYLNKQNGVYEANVNLVLAQASITYQDTVTIADLERYIQEAGFESLGIYQEQKDEQKSKRRKILLFIFFILTLFGLYLSMGDMVSLPMIPYFSISKNNVVLQFILVLFFLLYAFPIFKSGIRHFFNAPNMNTLVSLGVFASFFYSVFHMYLLFSGKDENLAFYFDSCMVIIFLVNFGRYLDEKNKEKTKSAIEDLVQITPEKALLKDKKKEKEVTIDEIQKGDILICKPGQKIAVDGVIRQGNAHIDESFITGESFPVSKKVSHKVIAGSLNLDGYIEYEAEKIGKDSTVSEIVKLVLEATNEKTSIEKFTDKICGYFVPGILSLASMTFIGYLLLNFSFNEAISSAVNVLCVACPCALGLATPLVVVISEGILAKKGILVKKSEVLELACQINTIVFDKTGTLTFGKLSLDKFYNMSQYTDKRLLSYLASIEKKSTHPIGNAFQPNSLKENISLKEVTFFKEVTGVGLMGTVEGHTFYIGNEKWLSKLKIKNTCSKEFQNLSDQLCTVLYIIEGKEIIGLVGIKDIVRENAKETIEKLKLLEKRVIMLTGDQEKTASYIANQVGIQEVKAGVLPKQKSRFIQTLIKNGEKVMMVGDGINDAISLASSSIGVSMKGATDIALNSADVILIKDDLSKLLTLLIISKRANQIIHQNLFWAFFYNILMLPLAMGLLKPFGFALTPMMSSLAMTLSSFFVVMNSLRLRKTKNLN